MFQHTLEKTFGDASFKKVVFVTILFTSYYVLHAVKMKNILTAFSFRPPSRPYS